MSDDTPETQAYWLERSFTFFGVRSSLLQGSMVAAGLGATPTRDEVQVALRTYMYSEDPTGATDDELAAGLATKLAASVVTAGLPVDRQLPRWDATNGRFAYADPTVVDPQWWGARADAVSVTDAAITSGQADLTSASTTFTVADVGKTVRVRGAGAAGADLQTMIKARVSAHVVTLGVPNGASVNAGTTVAAARATFGTDCTSAIQAAIDWAGATILAAATRASVGLPPGRLLLGSAVPGGRAGAITGGDKRWALNLPVNLTARLAIRGQGRGVTTLVLSDNARAVFAPEKAAQFDVARRYELTDFDVDNDFTDGRCHVVLGSQPAAATAIVDMSWQDVTVKRMRVYNVDPVPNTAIQFATRDKKCFALNALRSTDDPGRTGTLTFTKDILFEDVRMDQTQSGIEVCSYITKTPNHFYDNIVFRRCEHVILIIPTEAMWQTSFYICGAGYGNNCLIEDCYSENVGDDGVEVGAMQRIVINRFRCLNPFLEAILFRHSQPPPTPEQQEIIVEGLHVAVDKTAVTLGATAANGFRGAGVLFQKDDWAGTVTTANGSKVLTAVADVANRPGIGMNISGAGIPAGSYIRAIDTTAHTITINQNATADASAVPLTAQNFFGTYRLTDALMRTSDVNASTLARPSIAGAIDTFGWTVSGPVRRAYLTRCHAEMDNFTYDLASATRTYVGFVLELTPPTDGSTDIAGNSAKAQLRDCTQSITNTTVAGSGGAGSFVTIGIWAAGKGVLDVDGYEQRYLNAFLGAGTGGSHSVVWLGGTGHQLRFLRLSRLTAIKNNSAGVAYRGIVFNAVGGPAIAAGVIEKCDFRNWTGGGNRDVDRSASGNTMSAAVREDIGNFWGQPGTGVGPTVRPGWGIAHNVSFTLSASDRNVAVPTSTGAVTFTLPPGAQQPVGQVVSFYDETNNAATNNIIIQRAGADTFVDAATSKSITTNGGKFAAYWTGSKWMPV